MSQEPASTLTCTTATLPAEVLDMVLLTTGSLRLLHGLGRYDLLRRLPPTRVLGPLFRDASALAQAYYDQDRADPDKQALRALHRAYPPAAIYAVLRAWAPDLPLDERGCLSGLEGVDDEGQAPTVAGARLLRLEELCAFYGFLDLARYLQPVRALVLIDEEEGGLHAPPFPVHPSWGAVRERALQASGQDTGSPAAFVAYDHLPVLGGHLDVCLYYYPPDLGHTGAEVMVDALTARQPHIYHYYLIHYALRSPFTMAQWVGMLFEDVPKAELQQTARTHLFTPVPESTSPACLLRGVSVAELQAALLPALPHVIRSGRGERVLSGLFRVPAFQPPASVYEACLDAAVDMGDRGAGMRLIKQARKRGMYVDPRWTWMVQAGVNEGEWWWEVWRGLLL